MEEPDPYAVQDEERVLRIAAVIRTSRRLRVVIELHRYGTASASSLSKSGLGRIHDLDYDLRKLLAIGAVEVVEVRYGSRGAPQRMYGLTDFGREALRGAAKLGRVDK